MCLSFHFKLQESPLQAIDSSWLKRWCYKIVITYHVRMRWLTKYGPTAQLLLILHDSLSCLRYKPEVKDYFQGESLKNCNKIQFSKPILKLKSYIHISFLFIIYKNIPYFFNLCVFEGNTWQWHICRGQGTTCAFLLLMSDSRGWKSVDKLKASPFSHEVFFCSLCSFLSVMNKIKGICTMWISFPEDLNKMYLVLF